MPRAILIPAAIVGSVLAIAACGGGGGGSSSQSSSTSSGPTRSQFIAEANAICKSTAKQTAPLINQIANAGVSLVAGSATSAHQAATVVRRLRTIAASSLAQLRALAQPRGDHAAIQRMLTPLAGVVDTIGTAGDALSHGQAAQALGSLSGLQSVAQQLASAAKAYGLHACESLVSFTG
jgi:hypothetical protein